MTGSTDLALTPETSSLYDLIESRMVSWVIIHGFVMAIFKSFIEQLFKLWKLSLTIIY